MIWRITKRAVLKELHRVRWRQMTDHTATDFEKRYNGVPSSEVSLAQLFFNEMSRTMKKWYASLISKLLDKNYIVNYHPKIIQVISILKEEKYLREVNGRFALTGKGETLIKWWYPWKLFFGNAYVKAIIISAITVFVTSYITNNIIKRVTDAVIYNITNVTNINGQLKPASN